VKGSKILVLGYGCRDQEFGFRVRDAGFRKYEFKA
jgi:hypothetical protein